MKLPNTVRYFLLITTLITLDQVLLAPEEGFDSAPQKVEPVREPDRREESTFEMIKRKASEHARNIRDKISYHANRLTEAVKKAVAPKPIAFDAPRDLAAPKAEVTVGAKPVVREKVVSSSDFMMAQHPDNAYRSPLNGSSDVSITPEELKTTSPYTLQRKPPAFYRNLTRKQIEALPLDRLDSILNAEQIEALTDNLIEKQKAKYEKSYNENRDSAVKKSYERLTNLALKLLDEHEIHLNYDTTPEQREIMSKKLSDVTPEQIEKLNYNQMRELASKLDDAEISKMSEQQKDAFLLNIDRVIMDPKSFIDHKTWLKGFKHSVNASTGQK